MPEARIDRIVVGALHQALADHLPLRLDFYEEYLRPMRLREGRVSAASFFAALSFLRREDEAWEPVMIRAGRNAANWIWEGLSPWHRAWCRHLPARARVRRVLRFACGLADATTSESRATSAMQDQGGRLEIHRSAFCDVRHRSAFPMCRFYGSVLERLGELLDVEIRVHWESCRAMGHAVCAITFEAPERSGADAVPGGRVLGA